ncbi:MAG TPA: AbrB/MazE/SpoVT family DNA-binding domain-containing protein [Wenzhouxiangellaceae bacterium]|nr:AbrB/MazE/SpoVT family DNA-binding domain-containing protein [Wenzhouxiangellaceae bacterium]
MAKVTSKLQVTLPKRLAEAHRIAPGDRIEFQSSGDDIRIITEAGKRPSELSREERLRLFDEATSRIQARAKRLPKSGDSAEPGERGWKREDLYRRGSAD